MVHAKGESTTSGIQNHFSVYRSHYLIAIYTPHPLASKAIAQSTTINSSVLCATAHGTTALHLSLLIFHSYSQGVENWNLYSDT
jgi:hypothetical protein